jgi:hypothetical protein
VSTRRGRFVQTTDETTQRTCAEELPDSFMRCGGSLQRPVPAYTLHTIDSDGNDLRAISSAEGFEWHPSVMHDGRILYSRWDYVDRDAPFVSLWSTHPDGTDTRAIFGNYTKNPLAMLEAVCPRLASGDLHRVCSTCACGWRLVLLDPRPVTDEPSAIQRLTPKFLARVRRGQQLYAAPIRSPRTSTSSRGATNTW